MAIELPAYSGRAKLCTKCGTSYLKTVFHSYGGQPEPKMHDGRKPPCEFYDINDHQCRICPNCGYGFPEACADVQDDGDGSNGD
jgi:hypothetical protein